jgi:hypothetical protein
MQTDLLRRRDFVALALRKESTDEKELVITIEGV